MSPFNYELFEFNKMMIVYALTILIVSAWLIKMVVRRQFIFRKTFWDWPLLIFFCVQFLSFLFSIDRHTSLWGYYSRFHGGLLSTIAYLLLYWAFVSNLDRAKVKKTIQVTLISAALVAAYGIAERFGIDAEYWVQDVRNRVFSTLGQPNWLAAWLIALIPLTWALALNEKRKAKNERLIFYILHSIFFICLLFTKSRSGLLGFGATYLVFWSLILIKEKKAFFRSHQKPFLVLTFSILVFSLLIGTSWTPGFGKITKKIQKAQIQETKKETEEPKPEESEPSPLPPGGTESGEIRKIVWKGAIEIWKHHPILGTGPETFAYSYYWYRPREHNDVSEWDFLYNKAHNEYLNFAATTGTLGLLAYLGIIGVYIVWGLRKFKVQPTSRRPNNSALIAGFTSILVTNFFGFSVVPVALLFFLYPAITLVETEKLETKKEKEAEKILLGQWTAIAGILLLVCYLFLTISKAWLADTRFSRGEKLNRAGEYDSAFNQLQRAINLRKNEPVFHDELSWAAANLAVLTTQQEDAAFSNQLISLTIKESDLALKISPYNLNFWKKRTKLFYKLSEIEEKYLQNALEALLRAAELAPTDAKIHYNLALMYGKIGQEETAIKTLEETIELKSNYRAAHYALALFYEERGEKQKAIERLKYILEKISPDHKPSLEKLKSYGITP